MEINDNQNKYIDAKKRVKELKSFYSNLISYALFIPFLAGLNYYTNELRNPWFLWAAFGWGIGLIFQAVKTFNFFDMFGKDWEERKIKEFMDEDQTVSNTTNMWE